MEDELMRLAEEKIEGVYPDVMPKSFEVNGEDKYLTAAEYTKFQKTAGKKSYELLTDLYYDVAYGELTYIQKGEAIGRIYDMTKVIGKKSVSDYVSDSKWMEDAIAKGDEGIVRAAIFKTIAGEYTNLDRLYELDDKGFDIEKYIEFAQKIKGAGDKDPKTGETIRGSKQKDIVEILKKMNISNKERAYFFSTEYDSVKNNPWKDYLE